MNNSHHSDSPAERRTFPIPSIVVLVYAITVNFSISFLSLLAFYYIIPWAPFN